MSEVLTVFAWLMAFVSAASLAQESAVGDAVAAIQRGDAAGAEAILRAELKARPNEFEANATLSVVLDQEKKFSEAEQLYRRALAVRPHEAALLNNYGNHLVASGRPVEARGVFLKVLELRPGQANAAKQLARIAIQRKAGAEALGYVNRLPEEASGSVDTGMLRMAADYEMGRSVEADAIAETLMRAAERDSSVGLATGETLAAAGEYRQSEKFLEKRIAARSGDSTAWCDLAAAEVAEHQKEAALETLVKASEAAPRSADVMKLMAQLAGELGYLGDAVKAWERYEQLAPGDDAGRREHGFAETAMDADSEAGLAELQWFVRRHPNDALGRYELGTAEGAHDPVAARRDLDRAIASDPKLAGAYVARGILESREQDAVAAVKDFEAAVRLEPASAVIADRLGESYGALGRWRDAVATLRRAAEAAPADSRILLHLGRALTKAGDAEAAKTVFARCRELGPAKGSLPHPAGLMEFLSLPPEERMARYRAGLERTVKNDPGNAAAEVQYLELLLDEGRNGEALEVSRKIGSLQASDALLHESAEALLKAGEYRALTEMLGARAEGAAMTADLNLDLALAALHTGDEQAAVKQLDRGAKIRPK